MRKTILIAIVAVAMSLNLAAQVDDTGLGLTNEEFFNNSEFIVEGKLIGWTKHDWGVRSYDAKGNYNVEDIYTEIKFKIDFVYKSAGNLIKINDTIVIIADRGGIQSKPIIHDGYVRMYEEGIKKYLENNFKLKGIDYSNDRNNNIIMFLNHTDLPVNPNDNNNYFHTEFLKDRELARIKFWGKITGLNDLSFGNRYDLYEYMKQFRGLNVPKVPEKYNGKLDPNEIRDIFMKEALLNRSEFLQNSEIVVEGKAIYDNKNENIPDNMLKFVVSNVYKGDAINDGDTILIVRDKSRSEWNYKDTEEFMNNYKDKYKFISTDNDDYYKDRGLFISSDYPSILFCTNYNDSTVKYFKVKLKQDSEEASIKIKDKIHCLHDWFFDNRSSLYNFLYKAGVKGEKMKKYYEDKSENQPVNRTKTQQERIDNFNKIMAAKIEAAEKNKKKELKTTKAVDNNLAVSIYSQNISYDNINDKHYLEFDVYVNANSDNTYLDNVIFRLKYNTTAFGSNIADNNKVSVTLHNLYFDAAS